MATKPVSRTDANFATFIAATDLPVLVDSWAEWRGPCKLMAPHFARAAAQLPMARFAKVKTVENPKASEGNRIRSIPTMVLYHGGQVVARQSGALLSTDLLRRLQTQWAQGPASP